MNEKDSHLMSRRDFLGLIPPLFFVNSINKNKNRRNDYIDKLVSLEYSNISHTPISWDEISKGLYFTQLDILRDNRKIDSIAIVKINPEYNKIRVFNSYESPNNYRLLTIEQWQEATGATVMVNSAQYMAKPYAMPCALVICDGKQKGPKVNESVRGMLVAEPKDKNLPLADLLDFEYDKFDYKTTLYTQGVQHWPILLDRNKKIKVGKSNWQANRTIFAKDCEDNILFMTTEGGFFTLYNLARFVRDEGKSLNVHTAMNSDGGYEAEMIVKSPNLEYVTYGQFETYGPGKDASILNAKCKIPAAIGVFPRK